MNAGNEPRDCGANKHDTAQRREMGLKLIRQQLVSVDKVHPATPADNKTQI